MVDVGGVCGCRELAKLLKEIHKPFIPDSPEAVREELHRGRTRIIGEMERNRR